MYPLYWFCPAKGVHINGYPSLFFLKIVLKSSSIMNMLDIIKNAPKYAFALNLSFAKINATIAEKTGSREKTTPTCEAVVSFIAIG